LFGAEEYIANYVETKVVGRLILIWLSDRLVPYGVHRLERSFLSFICVRSAKTVYFLDQNGGNTMNAVIRTYSGKGATELFDVLEKHKKDVETLMRSVKGFSSYSLIRTGDGGMSVTVCQDKAGIGESGQKAKDWIGKNASSVEAPAPTVAEGSVILQLN
jgi:hypothetical protein